MELGGKAQILLVLIFGMIVLGAGAIFVPQTFTPTQASSQPNTIDPDAYSVSITSSSSIHLNLETVPYTNTIRSAKDTIQATVNAPSTTTNNFKLYLSTDSAESNSLNNGSSSIPATSATPFAASSLTGNSWGFALANTTPGLPSGTAFDETYQEGDPGKDSKWAQVPKKGSEQLIQTLPMNQSPYTTDIYYAISARDNLAEGTYNGTVLYTAIYDAAEARESTLSPTEGSTGTEIIVATSAKTDMDNPNMATMNFVNVDTNETIPCPNPTTSTTDKGLIQVKCNTPDLIKTGTYYVDVTITPTGATYRPAETFSFNYNWDTITTMQQMTSEICASKDTPEQGATDVPERTLKDTRDGKTYTIAKESDGHCWMTQNLDLDLVKDKILTPQDTNIAEDFNPDETTITDVSSWPQSQTKIHSLDAGEQYIMSSGSNSNDIQYNSLEACVTDGGYTESECKHHHVGNYYNWTAAIAMNDSSSQKGSRLDVTTSICPKGWRLPKTPSSSSTEWGALFVGAKVSSSQTTSSYATNGFKIIRTQPLWLVRGGAAESKTYRYIKTRAFYWMGTASSSNSNTYAYRLVFATSSDGGITSAGSNNRHLGQSVRCLAE